MHITSTTEVCPRITTSEHRFSNDHQQTARPGAKGPGHTPQEVIMLTRTRTITACAAAASALALGGTTALATTATTWTITPGGAVTGTAGKTVVTDTTTNAQMTCTSSSVEATLKSGTGRKNPLGQITAAAYNNCTAAGVGASITTSASSTNPWHLSGGTYSSGVTHGRLGNIQTSFSITGPTGTCSGIVAGMNATTPGFVKVTYHNSTGVLTTGGGNLHAWNVTGNCLGAIATGDPLTSVGHYKISPAQTITSP